MALKAEVEKLEDVGQQYRDQYKKIDGADGKTVFRLDVEAVGGLELTDPAGLLGTIEKLRPHEARSKKYGTITPEEATAAVAKVTELAEQLEELRTSKGGKFTDSEKQQLIAEMKRVHGEEIAKEKARSDARLLEVHRLRKEDAADAALIAVGFKSSRKFIRHELIKDLEVIEDENAKDAISRFKTVVRGPDAPERFVLDKATNSSRLMTAADRAAEMAQDKDLKRYLDVEDAGKPAQKAQNQNGYQPALNSGANGNASSQEQGQGGNRMVANPLAKPIENLRAALAVSKPVRAQ